LCDDIRYLLFVIRLLVRSLFEELVFLCAARLRPLCPQLSDKRSYNVPTYNFFLVSTTPIQILHTPHKTYRFSPRLCVSAVKILLFIQSTPPNQIHQAFRIATQSRQPLLFQIKSTTNYLTEIDGMRFGFFTKARAVRFGKAA
jgi:hypothetical protein